MFTNGYKGGFIHGKFDTDKVTYQLPNDYASYPANTYRAAQIAITNHLKKIN